MTKITKIDRNTCRLLAAAVEAALKKVAEDHGLSVNYAGCHFSPTTFKPKVEFAVIAADGTVESTETKAFRQMAGIYGLQPTDLGRTFKNGGKVHTIIGLRPKARTKPILTKSGDGNFIFAAETVVALLARQ